MKYSIFTTEKKLCILHGQVVVMFCCFTQIVYRTVRGGYVQVSEQAYRYRNLRGHSLQTINTLYNGKSRQ